MSLTADFRLRRGATDLAVELDVAEGTTLAIVGPNGAGKSTLLHAVAGLLRVDSGYIRRGDRTFDGGKDGEFTAPEDRKVGYVMQDSLLFPHSSVASNVAYGLRARGRSRAVATREAAVWLKRVGLESHAASKPHELSGGQRQRVAIARALATSPEILLLDEPLSAADASAKAALRDVVRRSLESFRGVRLLVTHAVVDAFLLADRLAVLDEGRIVQTGSVGEICSRPRSRYVADLVGLNFFQAVAHDHEATLADGGRLIIASPEEGQVILTIHPRAISLFRERPSGSPRNTFEAPIIALEPALDCLRVRLGGAVPLVAEITPAAAADLRLAAGDTVWATLKATEIQVQPI